MKLPDQTTLPISRTIFDFFISLLCLGILLPVIILLAIAIKVSEKGPIFYTQSRVGRYGKTFSIYKFRSLYPENEEGVFLLSSRDDSRITPIGRFMRNHKLDEIPNFINVLKGQMSIVGPRPEQQYYIDQIMTRAPEYKLIQSVNPGITSWGQVKYGYASNVEEMVERLNYDLFYLKNKSIWFDLKIIIYTFSFIIKGKGI